MTIIWEEQDNCYDPDEPVDFSNLYNEDGYELKELTEIDLMGLAFTLGDFMIPLCSARGKSLLQRSKIFASPSKKTQDVSPDFSYKAMQELLQHEPEIGLYEIWTTIRAIAQYPPYNQPLYRGKLEEIYKLLNRLANHFIWMNTGSNDINSKQKMAAVSASAARSTSAATSTSTSTSTVTSTLDWTSMSP